MDKDLSIKNKWWFEGRTALLVEDNDLAHELVRAIMKKIGIDIDICINGAEAVQAVQSNRYDLVLMDIQMPVMDGLEATREIRKLGGKMSALPIIAMTANVDREDIYTAREAGMNAHVGKPLNKESLYETISRFLDTNGEHGHAIVKATSELHTVIPKLAGINTDEGLQRIAGNTDAYLSMLRNFATKYADSADEIEGYLNNGNFEEVVRLAHNIKGNGGNIGAKALHLSAAALELACKNHSMDTAHNVLSEFKNTLNQVISSLNTLPAKVEAIATKEGHEFDSILWAQKSAAYIQLLDTDFGSAMDNLQELMLLADDKYRDEMLKLEKCVESFDADSARSILQNIQRQI